MDFGSCQPEENGCQWTARLEKGFFTHDAATRAFSLEMQPHFGLSSTPESISAPQCNGWRSVKERVVRLNADAPEGTVYRVLFLGRHGEAFHNIVAQKYGTAAWKDRWCKLYGDGEITWGPDPGLTPLGHSQVIQTRHAWEAQAREGMPLPQIAYCSPLRRALQTYVLRYGSFCPAGVQAVVLEDCREVIGVHTCDQRRPLSALRAEFSSTATLTTSNGPSKFEFDGSFTEEDVLWTPHHRETHDEVAVRVRRVLARVFEGEETYVMICTHGGWLRRLFEIVEHPLAQFKVPLGAVIPVVVKGVKPAVPAAGS